MPGNSRRCVHSFEIETGSGKANLKSRGLEWISSEEIGKFAKSLLIVRPETLVG
jgi:hypothetical protein